MKNLLAISSAFIALNIYLTPVQAYAADCASAAQSLANKEGAELLGISDLGDDKCEVTLRIPGKDGKPPRVISKKING